MSPANLAAISNDLYDPHMYDKNAPNLHQLYISYVIGYIFKVYYHCQTLTFTKCTENNPTLLILAYFTNIHFLETKIRQM
jgi:hypothetical protein